MGGSDYDAECPECGAMLPRRLAAGGAPAACPVCGAVVSADQAGVETGKADAVSAVEPFAALEAEGAGQPFAPLAVWADGPAFVCCVRERKVNPLDVGPLVESLTGLNRRDALAQVTKGMGILAEGVSPDAAEHFVRTLTERGVEAFAFPMPALPPVAKELKISRIYGADEEALHIQTDAAGTVKAMTWDRLAAGTCTQERSGGSTGTESRFERRPVMYGVGGLPAVAWQSVRKTTRRQQKPGMLVTLMLRDESGRAYPMSFGERRVRYAYLEDRIQANSTQNLSVFLSDVLRWGRPAFFPAGFRAAARGDTHHVTRVTGRLEAENYRRWVLCCAAARGLFAAEQ
jgi:hypothetical protein